MGFNKFVSLFENKVKAINHLSEIYKFLFQYEPNLIHNKYSIILNQNDTFIPFYNHGSTLSIHEK